MMECWRKRAATKTQPRVSIESICPVPVTAARNECPILRLKDGVCSKAIQTRNNVEPHSV